MLIWKLDFYEFFIWIFIEVKRTIVVNPSTIRSRPPHPYQTYRKRNAWSVYWNDQWNPWPSVGVWSHFEVDIWGAEKRPFKYLITRQIRNKIKVQIISTPTKTGSLWFLSQAIVARNYPPPLFNHLFYEFMNYCVVWFLVIYFQYSECIINSYIEWLTKGRSFIL